MLSEPGGKAHFGQISHMRLAYFGGQRAQLVEIYNHALNK